MPDILGFWDRWADSWYYPREYASLNDFEKWVDARFNRAPTEGDRRKYKCWQKQQQKEKAQTRT